MPGGEILTTYNSHMAPNIRSNSVWSIETTLFFFCRCILVMAPGTQDVPINLLLISQLPNRLAASMRHGFLPSSVNTLLTCPRAQVLPACELGESQQTIRAILLLFKVWANSDATHKVVLVFLIPAYLIATHGQFQQLTTYFLFYSIYVTAFWSHRSLWPSKWQLRSSGMPSAFNNKTQQQQQKLSFSHPQISITSCWTAAVLFHSGFDDPLLTRDLVKI